MIDTQKAMGNLIRQVEIEKYNFYKIAAKEPTHIFINKRHLLQLANAYMLVDVTKEGMRFLGLQVCWIENKGFSVGTLIKFEEVIE